MASWVLGVDGVHGYCRGLNLRAALGHSWPFAWNDRQAVTVRCLISPTFSNTGCLPSECDSAEVCIIRRIQCCHQLSCQCLQLRTPATVANVAVQIRTIYCLFRC